MSYDYNSDPLTVRTTIGEAFTGDQHRELATLIFIRFGRDYIAAWKAWQRLMQNNCSRESFIGLVNK